MFIPEIPNNSLSEEIREIVDIAKKMDGIKRFAFNPPATDTEICEIEKIINYSLPDDYKDFLKFSNGMVLNGLTAEFFNTYEVIDYYNQEKESGFPTDYIVMADIIGDGEILCVSSETGKFIRFFNGEETFFETFKDALTKIISFIKKIDDEYLEEE